MALKTCFTLLHYSQHSSSRTFFSIPSFNSATFILHNEPHNNHILHFSTFFTKKEAPSYSSSHNFSFVQFIKH
ncbi:hypothetical protein HN873_027326 [Arachis hypogaea]